MREERYYTPPNPQKPPMCLLVHVWDARANVTNMKGEI
jgi:hypothetical protein